MSGAGEGAPRRKPRFRRDLLLGALVLLPVLLAALAVLFWKPVMVRYTIWDLRRLRARGPFNDDGSDECVSFLVSQGVVRPGMSREEIIRVLGKPERDSRVATTGERCCEWHTMDLGHAPEIWVVTFGPDGRARFVPYAVKRRDDASGRRWVHHVRRPDDPVHTAREP